MNIKSLLKRGHGHADFCQDATYSFESNDYIICAVFDGCSEVKDSHFASNLLKKIFKYQVESITKRFSLSYINNDFDADIDSQVLDITEVANEILHFFFQKASLIQEELNLTADDFMSTCIFLFYDKTSEKGVIYMFGDGFLQINNITTIVDHENKPKYFVNYWKELTNDYYSFIKDYNQIWNFGKINNVIISTDGILTFSHEEKDAIEAVDFLLNDQSINNKKIIHQNSFYEKKYNYLLYNNWKHNDDLGIIRICEDE